MFARGVELVLRGAATGVNRNGEISEYRAVLADELDGWLLGPARLGPLGIDGGGLGSAILANPEGYKNVRRPIWPLDPI